MRAAWTHDPPTLRPVAESIWIAKIHVSPKTATKLSTVHYLDAAEVRAELECRRGLRGRLDQHPERGLRALIYISVRGRRVLTVLYPAGDPFGEEWNLGSAYEV